MDWMDVRVKVRQSRVLLAVQQGPRRVAFAHLENLDGAKRWVVG